MISHQRAMRILDGSGRSLPAALLRIGLAVLELAYSGLVQLRNCLYDAGLKHVHHLPRTTISVGNITTGGTGKTPMVVELAQRLQRLGARPAILLRGYKATQGGSDEALVLRGALGPDVPVEADADRVAAARRVLTTRPEVTAFLLDDGFQHRRVARDLNLVLLDATNPFGFEHVLPRGLLREPLRNLRRADAVVITRADQVAPADLAKLNQRVEQLTGRPPTATAAHLWTGLLDHHDQPVPLERLRDLPVAGLCGIGNPAAFERTLRQHAPNCTGVAAFDDHYAWPPGTVQQHLTDLRREGRAQGLVMTEKDWVKWRPLLPGEPGLPIYRAILRLRFMRGEAAMEELLARVAPGPADRR